MSRVLHNFAELQRALAADTLKVVAAAELALHASAELVEADAKRRIGEYQPETGPFPAWEPLAESTEAEKGRLGLQPGEPLLRDGTLRDSIVTEHRWHEAVVRSEDPVAAYQEFGTEDIPPRPFLGPAAFENRETIHTLIGVAAVAALAGKARPE